jgi:cysteine desulfurase
LLVLLERDNVMASAAASCASGAMEPSHVLAAMGMDRTAAAGSLRLSMGWCTESREIDVALKVIPKAVEQLRVSL